MEINIIIAIANTVAIRYTGRQREVNIVIAIAMGYMQGATFVYYTAISVIP